MRILFMGTPDFAEVCLNKLVQSRHEVVCAISQPDKPVGRKQVCMPTPVKSCALENGIPVYQPEKIKTQEALDTIKSYNADVIVVVAYGKILSKEILECTKYGCINVHASLLPLYRGAAPIQWAVLNGDEKTGVSIMQMDEGLDTGDVFLVKETDIDINETSAELFDRLAVIGADALVETLDLLEKGEITPQKQADKDCQYASMIDKSMCPIDWSNSALKIHNQVRGLQTWPVAITTLNGKNLKIHKTVLTDINGNNAGEIIDNNKRLVVSCGDGKCLEILEVQLDGKKRMDTKSFLSGNNVEIGTILGG